eukprot:3880563-Rhodomonas_salina.2
MGWLTCSHGPHVDSGSVGESSEPGTSVLCLSTPAPRDLETKERQVKKEKEKGVEENKGKKDNKKMEKKRRKKKGEEQRGPSLSLRSSL